MSREAIEVGAFTWSRIQRLYEPDATAHWQRCDGTNIIRCLDIGGLDRRWSRVREGRGAPRRAKRLKGGPEQGEGSNACVRRVTKDGYPGLARSMESEAQ
jgi:hypothetical protein